MSEVASVEIAALSRIDLIRLLQQAEKEGDVLLLESQLRGHPASKDTFLFADFDAVLKFNEGRAVIYTQGGANTESLSANDPWEALSLFRKVYPGYATGYLSYDLKNYREKLTSRNLDELGLPEMWMGRPRKVYRLSPDPTVPASDEPMNLGFTRSAFRHIAPELYIERVKDIKRRIQEGDVYEVNFSHRCEADFEGSRLGFYEHMRKIGPVPFAAYMALGETTICCSSPERFLAKTGLKIVSDPIKGTRPRHEDPIEDHIIKDELLHSEKDRAENLMIVDLVRNDLNRVCRPGTVKPESLFEIQSFGTVHQLVSRISGELNAEVTPEEVLAACFPMGSMTGAPKISAMEIIDELEDYRRGLYSGAIGYLSPDGDFNFNVVIRTAIIRQNRLYYATGGAITSDSDPAGEWEETLVKTRALGTI